MPFTANITSRGQITIPRDIRKMLGSNTVEIDLKDGEVILRPVKSVTGVLAKYGGGMEPAPLYEIREKVCEEVVRDRTRKTASLPERPIP